MALIYLAGKLSARTPAGVRRNIARAAKVAGRLWKVGHQVWSPHGHTGSFFGLADVPDKRFLALDLVVLEHVPFDALVVLPDDARHTYCGLAQEKALARRRGIPVIAWDKRTLTKLAKLARVKSAAGETS